MVVVAGWGGLWRFCSGRLSRRSAGFGRSARSNGWPCPAGMGRLRRAGVRCAARSHRGSRLRRAVVLVDSQALHGPVRIHESVRCIGDVCFTALRYPSALIGKGRAGPITAESCVEDELLAVEFLSEVAGAGKARDGLGPGRGVWVTTADVGRDGLPVEEVDRDFVICPFRGEDAAVVLVESSTIGVTVGGRDAAAGVCILASGVDVAV